MEGKPHERLLLWERATALVVRAYRVSATFPKSELFGLRLQLRRATVSVPSDITEGLTRTTIPENFRFLNIARASLSEIDTQIEISVLLQYLGPDEFQKLQSPLSEVEKLLSGPMRKLRSTNP